MKYIFNKKFLFLIPLLIAIPISVVLVQKKQEMRKKAVESEVTTETLENWLTDVPAATGSKYGAMDDKGNRLDTIKIIENPAGGYLGVYHTLINGIFSVKLAKSSDLLNWTYFTDLDSHAAQPAIAKLSDNGFLVVYEKWFSGQASIGFRYYPNQNSLFAGSFSQEFYAPYTLSNLQGTPNIYSVNLSPNISNSTIEIGFHFYDWNKKGDRQAGGKLVNFSSWSAQQETPWNSQLEQMGIKFIGDRDKFSVGGKQYNIIETNTTLLGDSNFWCSWKPYLYDYEQNIFSPLNIKTHKGSRSFGNPTVTPLTSPSGKPAIVVTLFNFCAASGEAGGPLIYYKEYSTSLLPTNTPTPIGTPTPTPTLTPSLTPTPSPTPFPTPTPSPTPTPIPTPTSTPTPTPTPSPTPTPTPKPTATPTPTPIPTPTSTPTPTPTQAPDTANLTFKVKFQGINQQRPDKTVKITLTKAGNTVATFENEGVASDGNGVYTGKIMNINPDTYNIFIKGWAHLQKKFEGIILTEGENIQNWSGVELLAGDAAGDDKINIQDFRILVEDYLKSESPADFNLDRKVNIQDFRFIVENYLKEGEK